LFLGAHVAEELGERTELPTGRRLSEARNAGQVAKSMDLAAAIDLLGAVLLVSIGGGAAIAGFAGILRRVLEGQVPGNPFSAESMDALLMWIAVQGAKLAAPALIIMLAISVLGSIVQVGWHVTTKPLAPKIDRLNPVGGFKKLFNIRSLAKTALNSVKLGIVMIVAWLLIRKDLPVMVGLPALGLAPAMYKIALLAGGLVSWLLAILLALGLGDYIFQRWKHTHDLRMTKQEVKDERRNMEGDPEMKSRRFRMAREIAMQRIRQAVPRADVIVTNPTHFSVALKYDMAKMAAPRVVAKGVDDMAFRIREIAIANKIPIVERPPLARGLYWGVDVGQEIKPQFYEAVAEVLAYVYRLKGKAA
jgi:flagellar biosynthetic protein FlhB